MLKVLTAIAALALSVSSGLAGEADFYGTWKITGAITAPWQDPAHSLPDEERLSGAVVKIAKDVMQGPALLGCAGPAFQVKAIPYAGLFEGGLAADPTDAARPYDEARAKKLAEGLGFAAEPVDSLVHSCSEIILHRLDPTTVVFGLDNRIFTLKRQ